MKKTIAILLLATFLLAGCSIKPTQANGSESPTQADSSERYIEQIITTFTANFALTSDGEVFSWGTNDFSVLGLGDDAEEYVGYPTKVEIGEPVQKLVSTSLANTVLAIAESGNIYGWGCNKYKILSSDNQTVFSSPILLHFKEEIEDIKLSHYLLTILNADGKVYGCGWAQQGTSVEIEQDASFLSSDNSLKEIHVGTNEPLVQVENSVVFRSFLNTQGEVFVQGPLVEEKVLYEQTQAIEFPETIVKIGAMYQGLVALSETGKLYFVGEDRFGTVGDDIQEYYDIFKTPVHIDKMHKPIKDIIVSTSSIIALTTDGEYYTWGYNLKRNNADSDDEVVTKPNLLPFDKKVRYAYCGEFSSVFITEDNAVYVWGSNFTNLSLDKSRQASYLPTKVDFSAILNQV